MDLYNFTESLKKLRPSDEALIKSGFTFVPNDIVKNYVLDKKENIVSDDKSYSTIIRLFNIYDTQYLAFDDFNFYKEIEKRNDFFVFAGSSSSELVFKSFEYEVAEYDREEWSLIDYCAKNTESFLAALLPLFEMYSLRLQRVISRSDKELNASYLEKCVSAAGGIKYKRFYKDIIG